MTSNSAVEQTAGSRSLAAAAHCGRSAAIRSETGRDATVSKGLGPRDVP
jgi:hypothetical protein